MLAIQCNFALFLLRLLYSPQNFSSLPLSMSGKYTPIRTFLGNNRFHSENTCRNGAFGNLRKSGILIFGIVCLFVLISVWTNGSTRPPLVFPKVPKNTQSICGPYGLLYSDAIATHQYYVQRAGIQFTDLADSKKRCDDHGQCLQIKLFDMNLYVGNASGCFESRAQSFLMNLNMAVEQARMEGESLPDFDVYMSCHDRPIDGARAAWYISKSIHHVTAYEGEDNFFLMPDFNFYSWPEALNEPWR